MPDINGIPYVESTDLVSGWPTVSQSVAQEVSDQLASKLDLAGGKILQIVRATDSTQRTTNSTTAVDVTGMAVTITPQKSDSAIIIICSASIDFTGSGARMDGQIQIADSSNNPLNGATTVGIEVPTGTLLSTNQTIIGYATPATTSPVTYKMRFRVINAAATIRVQNSVAAGQIYALEVSA